MTVSEANHSDATAKKYRIDEAGYILRNIAGEYIIVPIDESSVFSNAMMMPNDSAVFLWNCFLQPSTIDEVVEKGLEEYEVDRDHLQKTVQSFVEEGVRFHIIREES